VIMKNPRWACEYALEVIKGRWPEVEAILFGNQKEYYRYINGIITVR